MFTSGSPNAGQLQIGIALVLQDRFSNQAREASSEIRRLHQEAKNVTNANLSAVQNIAGAGAAIAGGMSMALIGAVKEGANFVDTMTFVDAIAKKSVTSIGELKKQARSLGRDTMFDSQDIASGMKFMAQAGLSTKEIQANIKGAANLAGATDTTLGGKGGAADMLTSIMRIFEINSSEANSNRVADVLSKITTRSKTSLSDLSEGITYAGSTLTGLNVTLEQSAAFMGILADNGMRGSMAGTAISNAYRYLAKSIGDPKFKGHAALKSLGLGKQDFMDANGNLIDMGEAIKKIANASKGMGSVDRFNKLVSIFNVRGERAGTVMIKNLDKYVELLNELQTGSQGTAANIMEMRMNTIAGGIDIMTSSLENLVSTFTEKIDPIVTPILKHIGAAFDAVSAILNIPYLGPTLSFLTMFTLGIVTIRLSIIALTATFRLMFNDSTVSFANMISVMTVGWRKATMSAAQYAAMQAGIQAQQAAGISGNGAANFAAAAGLNLIHSKPGTYVNGVMFKNGRYYQQNAAGGVTRQVSAAAAANLANSTPQQLGLINATPSTGLRGAGLWGGAKAVGRMGFNLMGGWYGIAAMGIFMLLPKLISALTGNTDSHVENTSATNVSNSIEIEKLNRSTSLNREEQNIMLAESMNNLALALREKGVGGAAATTALTINIDGKEAIKKEIKSNGNQEVIDLGSK